MWGRIMGMFDSVMVPCPACGTVNEFQSKGGLCQLRRYTPENAPADVLGPLLNETEQCSNCGAEYRVQVRCKVKAVLARDYVNPHDSYVYGPDEENPED